MDIGGEMRIRLHWRGVRRAQQEARLAQLRLQWLGLHSRGYDVVNADDIEVGKPLKLDTRWNAALEEANDDQEAALIMLAASWPAPLEEESVRYAMAPGRPRVATDEAAFVVVTATGVVRGVWCMSCFARTTFPYPGPAGTVVDTHTGARIIRVWPEADTEFTRLREGRSCQRCAAVL